MAAHPAADLIIGCNSWLIIRTLAIDRALSDHLLAEADLKIRTFSIYLISFLFQVLESLVSGSRQSNCMCYIEPTGGIRHLSR